MRETVLQSSNMPQAAAVTQSHLHLYFKTSKLHIITLLQPDPAQSQAAKYCKCPVVHEPSRIRKKSSYFTSISAFHLHDCRKDKTK
jgi:hypothetical protein